MKNIDITQLRLQNQHLINSDIQNPADVVSGLGAVQAQDYAGAKWAVGQRTVGATDKSIEQAFNEGNILRTHVMRPTWHFVSPADIRWILQLTAPRVHAANAYMYRTLELDKAIFKHSQAVLEKALRDGKHLTRAELTSVLKQAGIFSNNLLRFTYLIMRAELDGLICSGPRRGKQFTYALLEERVPKAKEMSRNEALAELLKRYFATRGPATLQDFVWWSGLTMADVKSGVELIKSQLVNERLNGQTYWFSESRSSPKEKSPTAYLLPNYDEYFIGLKDRSAIRDVVRQSKLPENSPSLIAYVIILDGQIVGEWKRTLKKDSVIVELNLITSLTNAEDRAVTVAAERYGAFLELPVDLRSAAASTQTAQRLR